MNTPAKNHAKAPAGGNRVLIVEDDPINIQVLTFHLQSKGFEVFSVEDGESAFEAVQAREFDVVLLDLVMPGMTGFDVLRRLFSDGKTAVIVLTGHADAELREIALGMGARDLLAKPYDFDAIDRAMARALA